MKVSYFLSKRKTPETMSCLRGVHKTVGVLKTVIENPERKLSDSNVMLESDITLLLTIYTGPFDRLSACSQNSSSTFKQLRHTYAVHCHTRSLFPKNLLIYANIPLCMHSCI